MTRARIIGIGAYAPKRILTNEELERMVETSDEWIVQRTGIRERHIVDENEATSDLAIRAAQQALEPGHVGRPVRHRRGADVRVEHDEAPLRLAEGEPGLVDSHLPRLDGLDSRLS